MKTKCIQFARRSWLAPCVLLIAVFVLSACEVTGPERAFLLRFPEDVIHGEELTVPLYTAAADSSGTVDFEWEAAPGAKAYELTFWRAADADSMNQHRVDFETPSFAITAPSAQAVMVPFNPGDPEDERELAVVQFDLELSELARVLESAGMPEDEELYFIWSVFAEDQDGRWRSPENQRIRFILLPPSAPGGE